MGATNERGLELDNFDEDLMEIREDQDIDLSEFSWKFVLDQIMLLVTMIVLSYYINYVSLLKIYAILLLKLSATCYDIYGINENDSRTLHKWVRQMMGVFNIELALQLVGIKWGALLWLCVMVMSWRFIIDSVSKLQHVRFNRKIIICYALIFSPVIFIVCK